MPAPIIRERYMGEGRVEAFYFEGGGFPAMAIEATLPYAARRARELEAHGYAEWVPPFLRQHLGACMDFEDEVFCLAYSDPAKVPAATVLAIRSVIEEMEPGWVAAVGGARCYADDPRVLAAWCEIPLQAVMACLEVLRERGGARRRPGDAA